MDSDALFLKESGNKWYINKRTAQDASSLAEKIYWNSLYKKHQEYLGGNFLTRFPNDPLAGLWELTLSEFLYSHESAGLEMTPLLRKKSMPDFGFNLQGTKFFLEATTTSAGNRVELNQECLTTQSRTIPFSKYNESFCSAIQYKGVTKYEEYKLNIPKNSGFIIAISTTKISSHDHPLGVQHELSCLFGISDMEFIIDQQTQSMTGPIPQKTFEKANNASIDKIFFEKNPQVSCILMSYKEEAFFPDCIQYRSGMAWNNGVTNDFHLIHNPFADVPFPQKFLSVSEEI